MPVKSLGSSAVAGWRGTGWGFLLSSFPCFSTAFPPEEEHFAPHKARVSAGRLSRGPKSHPCPPQSVLCKELRLPSPPTSSEHQARARTESVPCPRLRCEWYVSEIVSYVPTKLPDPYDIPAIRKTTSVVLFCFVCPGSRASNFAVL